MKYYQLTYLISPELSIGEIKNLQEKIKLPIEKEGILEKIENPVKKKLAYKIKKKSEAFLANLNFYLSPEKLGNLEKKLKAENNILRLLILVKGKPKILPEIKKPKKIAEEKVELKEIEKKLEEILGE